MSIGYHTAVSENEKHSLKRYLEPSPPRATSKQSLWGNGNLPGYELGARGSIPRGDTNVDTRPYGWACACKALRSRFDSCRVLIFAFSTNETNGN